MRNEAWEATKRYVAISLTDRDLNVLKEIDNTALKFTIHGKKGELHFISSTLRDVNMTAQHSTGGIMISKNKSKVSFQYRLQRESEGEVPVLVGNLPDNEYSRNKYGPLYDMQSVSQPFCYVSDPHMLSQSSLHEYQSRRV